MATIEQRIMALEQKTVKPPKVVRIICKGAEPTPEEWAQINEAEAQGYFVIYHAIVKPPKYNH